MERAIPRAVSAAAYTVMSFHPSDAGHEQLLRALDGYTISELRQHMSQHPDDISLGFLEWLATR